MTQVMNQSAYERGKQRNIKNNARKTGRAKWFAAHDDAQELYDWLNQTGQFGSKVVTKNPADQQSYDEQVAALWADAQENDYCAYNDVDQLDYKFDTRTEYSPYVEGMFSGDFGNLLLNMRDNLDEWGKLSDKQTDIVRNALARKRQWVADAEARKEARKEELKGSEWVGEVKDRQFFNLNVNHVMSFDGQYGMTYLHFCEDDAGNQFVYKGTKLFEKGPLTVKATVKAHETRDGVKQTVLSRPTEVEVE